MVTTLAVVEVRPAIEPLPPSSPLAGMARRRFGGKSLLEWVVRRVSDAERLSGIVVLASDDPLSHQLCEHCPPDTRVLHSKARDPLGCFAEAARTLPCDGLVRLNVSHPFVDPDLIDCLVGATDNSDCDYASFSFSDGRPVIESKLGVFAEWCRADAVVRADRLAKSPADRAEPTRFMYSRPDLFSLKLTAVPPRLDRDDLRLAIYDEEDWEELQTIFDALGPELLDWQYIASLVDRQPSMRARMARRNQESAGVC
jgi:spore coat polysaccharide biosynthesis protein SpsF (cytidylyltransferase family)